MGAEVAAWHSGANAYLVVWQRDGNVWARPFLSTGTPLNPAFAVSTASGAAPATQPAVAPIPGASTFLVAWNQSGFDGDGRILGRAVTTTKPKDDIFPIAEEPLAVRGAPTLAAGSEGTHLLAWEDRRGGNVDVYARLLRQEVVVDTKIHYTYDPLYRLTTAAYSGHISADYRYTYDEAGNMTAYTEQVNGQTTSVSRTFNAANQLVSSDDGSETVNYAYDANGNLTIIDHWLMSAQTTYTYDQRNLLTNQTNWSISEPDLQAAFVYDGDGRRVQMIDHTGLPLTITYTNDILGMTQVLLADDGTTTTANLFGLDLISQDDGTQTRFLLTDGLGSVRQELAGGDLQTTTTYEPYGNLLTQTGTSGTTYGFTGEQEDAATGLLYLRARYYNPSLNQFQSRDPFAGYDKLPISQNGYNYVNANPVNYIDPTGNWAWGTGEAISLEANDQASDLVTSAVHLRIQAKLGVIGSRQWHAEYPIPGTPNYRIDLLNSNLGEIWEIKPRYLEAEAWAQVVRYQGAMNAARGRLHGPSPYGGAYNWDFSPLQWTLGSFRFPSRELLGTDPSGWVNIYYGQTQPGVIVWWKEKRQTQEVRNPVRLPDWVVWSPKNWYPSLDTASIPIPSSPPIPQGTPVPPNVPGLPPQPNPQPVPTPPIYYYGTPTPVSVCPSNNDNLGNSIVTTGGATVGAYIVYRIIRFAMSPMCGPAAPLCAIAP